MRLIGKSPSRLVFLLCALLAMYFAYTAVDNAVRNQRVQEARREAELAVAELEAEKRYLQGIVEYVQSDEYVELEARRRLGFVRPGEVPFVIISPPAPEEEVVGEWWERMFPR